MAEGFARHLGRGVAEAASGGTAPAGFVAPLSMEVMREKGIDISQQKSKKMDLAEAKRADIVVTLCAEADDACPAALLKKIVSWKIPDPMGGSIDDYRRARDLIEARVRALLRGLDVSPPPVRPRHIEPDASAGAPDIVETPVVADDD